MSTKITGLKWLTGIIDSQGNWFENQCERLTIYVGSTDRSVRFLDPRAWYAELLMGTGRWFVGAITLCGGYLPALCKDIMNIVHNPKESLASIAATPIYVVIGSAIYLVISTTCIAGLIIVTIGGVLAVSSLLAYWGVSKLGSLIGDGLSALFKLAMGK